MGNLGVRIPQSRARYRAKRPIAFTASATPGSRSGGHPSPRRRAGKGNNVQLLHLSPGPGGAAQKLEAGFDRRVALETVDIDALRQPVPAVMVDQSRDNLLQGDAVQGVVGLLMVHRSWLITALSA